MIENVENTRKLPVSGTIPTPPFALRRQGRQFESAWGHTYVVETSSLLPELVEGSLAKLRLRGATTHRTTITPSRELPRA